MTHHLFLARNPSFLLFSAELFSDTRLSQANQFAQFAKSIKNNLIMQNKPNFRNAQINVTSALTKDYRNEPPRRHPQNKANSKPILTSQPPFKAKTNPISNPNKPNFKRAIALAKAGQTQFSRPTEKMGQAGFFWKNM